MVEFYPTECKFKDKVSKYDTKITIVDNDTLGAAEDGYCCLNFASHKRPGGGYKHVMDLQFPIKTQEEDLFRRSNLPGLMDTPEIRNYYPLKDLDAIYTTGIIVNKSNKLKLLDKPFNINLITLPALVSPKKEQYGLVMDKIKRILDIAADNQQINLVLGAWGCGVFYNDPRVVSQFFVNFLKNEFKGVFEKVIFAIPNKESFNYKMFENSINFS